MRNAAVVLICAGLLSAQSQQTFRPTVSAPEQHLAGATHTAILNQLREYSQPGGAYERDILKVTAPARQWLEMRTARTLPGEKLAAVFDIDETMLSNLPDVKQCDFCGDSVQAKFFPPENDRLPAIAPVLDLFNFAKSKGVAIFIVSGRKESARELSVLALAQAGYSGWQDLALRPAGDAQSSGAMKAGVRKNIESKGYRIILNIGDQLSDLAGGYAERTYKLPNPFYFVK